MKTLWFIFEIISGNHFNVGHCDPDLWPSDPKIYTSYLLIMTNLLLQYEDFMIYSFQNNQRKPFGLPNDRPTDRQTIAKQYIPSSSKGGMIKYCTLFYSDSILFNSTSLLKGRKLCISRVISIHTSYVPVRITTESGWHTNPMILATESNGHLSITTDS